MTYRTRNNSIANLCVTTRRGTCSGQKLSGQGSPALHLADARGTHTTSRRGIDSKLQVPYSSGGNLKHRPRRPATCARYSLTYGSSALADGEDGLKPTENPMEVGSIAVLSGADMNKPRAPNQSQTRNLKLLNLDLIKPERELDEAQVRRRLVVYA